MKETYEFVYYNHYTFGNILGYIKNYLVDGEIYTILKYKNNDNPYTQYLLSGSFSEEFVDVNSSLSNNSWAMDEREIYKITSETDPIVLFKLIKIR
jgi:hypothetical protein